MVFETWFAEIHTINNERGKIYIDIDIICIYNMYLFIFGGERGRGGERKKEEKEGEMRDNQWSVVLA